ncbi:MAG: hypothetical protein AAGF78_02855 [Pseudomonadota bacterium]
MPVQERATGEPDTDSVNPFGTAALFLAAIAVGSVLGLGVVLFFALTYMAARVLTSLAGLSHLKQFLLAMTMATRNAPLMLALTAVTLPDTPLVLAVIVFGMLVEIPYLTLVRQILLRRTPYSSEARHVFRPRHL